MNKWQVGDATITRVVELVATGGSRFILPTATPEAVREIDWLKPHFATDEGKLIMSVHALIIELGDRRIMVDTCIGNDKQREIPAWTNLQLPFLEDIAAAGYPRECIDTVLCTHLHVDHVGWNTMLVDGAWVPTFPDARYLLGRDEFTYWEGNRNEGGFGDYFGDSVVPILEAGLIDLVDSDHQICDEIRLEPSPGHSPGHVSIHITSRGEEALITGDFMHHPCQLARPDWASSADYDQDAARETRKEMLTKYADRPVLVIGTHFAAPTAGHIVRDGDVFRLDV
jgi:glyoxylase-like metal-dependent hydrolase (beta-lactamase superfamily II)